MEFGQDIPGLLSPPLNLADRAVTKSAQLEIDMYAIPRGSPKGVKGMRSDDNFNDGLTRSMLPRCTGPPAQGLL
jgi:hypothetical protein